MSQSDSFIDEVTEELRRDRLSMMLRRYGWIAALVVLILVGAAAWLEWRDAQSRAARQAAGEAMLSALEAGDPAERAAALDAVAPGDGAAAIARLLEAGAQQEAGEAEAAVATLEALAEDPDTPQLYRDLAGLKALMISAPGRPLEEVAPALEAHAAPGAPFRLLAEEQLAHAEIRAGETEAAVERLRAIRADAAATQGQRGRAEALITALGYTPEDDPAGE